MQSWLWALPALLVLMGVAWAASLARRDVSVVDVFWGPAFGVAAVVYYTRAADPGIASALGLIAVILWALRLAVHLGVRWLRKGEEDYRYAAMRAEHGESFGRRSLLTVFWFQAVLAWILSVPILAVVNRPGDPGAWGLAGLGIFLVGFAWEAVADLQLSRFRRDAGNRGKVLESGLWRYSRHPNYFGEAMLWWGLYLMAVDAGAAWTVFAPVGMTFLLLRVSGVPLLEPHLEETRPEYRDYARRTPAFVPWLPRKE